MAKTYDNYGVLHQDSDIDSAIFYYKKSLEIKKTNRDLIGIPYSLNKLRSASVDESTISSTVYPNPTSDILNIVSTEKIISITITSLDGKMIKKETSSSIVVEELKSGIYMYSVITESGKTSQGDFVKKTNSFKLILSIFFCVSYVFKNDKGLKFITFQQPLPIRILLDNN